MPRPRGLRLTELIEEIDRTRDDAEPLLGPARRRAARNAAATDPGRLGAAELDAGACDGAAGAVSDPALAARASAAAAALAASSAACSASTARASAFC